MKWTKNGLALLLLQLASLCSLAGQTRAQFSTYAFRQEKTPSRPPAPVPAESATAPHCEILGTQEIKITCAYTPTSRSSPHDKAEPRIVLNRAVLSFGTIRDSYMLIDLTLTNEGTSLIAHAPTVSLAVDDEAGRNLVRRILPKVDLSKLSPGVPVTFSERLLIGGIRAGRYGIYLSIPNSDPSLNSDPAHNLLLSSVGVPDPAAGSNTIAHFTVEH